MDARRKFLSPHTTLRLLSCLATSHMHPLLWNALPPSLRAIDNITSFQKQLKMHFLGKHIFRYFRFTFFTYSLICSTIITPYYISSIFVHFSFLVSNTQFFFIFYFILFYHLQGTKLRLIQSPMRLKLSCWRPRFKS